MVPILCGNSGQFFSPFCFHFQGKQLCTFSLFLLNKDIFFKGKNLHLKEKILSFKSTLLEGSPPPGKTGEVRKVGLNNILFIKLRTTEISGPGFY